MNGLSNQIFGIYSYIPVALLWNVSLIVGDVYSRRTFDKAMAKYDESWVGLPFSNFFDFPHFAETWAKRGVTMMEHRQYAESCIASSYKVLTVQREPSFWPNKDQVINKMLEKAEIPLPIPNNTVVQFDAQRPKFTAIYNFWKGGMRNKLLLLHVHRSLRPAQHLQRVIDAILGELPAHFMVAHIRLEGEMIWCQLHIYKYFIFES